MKTLASGSRIALSFRMFYFQLDVLCGECQGSQACGVLACDQFNLAVVRAFRPNLTNTFGACVDLSGEANDTAGDLSGLNPQSAPGRVEWFDMPGSAPRGDAEGPPPCRTDWGPLPESIEHRFLDGLWDPKDLG